MSAIHRGSNRCATKSHGPVWGWPNVLTTRTRSAGRPRCVPRDGRTCAVGERPKGFVSPFNEAGGRRQTPGWSLIRAARACLDAARRRAATRPGDGTEVALYFDTLKTIALRGYDCGTSLPSAWCWSSRARPARPRRRHHGSPWSARRPQPWTPARSPRAHSGRRTVRPDRSTAHVPPAVARRRSLAETTMARSLSLGLSVHTGRDRGDAHRETER
jgi:hypothetical protein